MKKLQLSTLSIFSGILLYAGWPVSPFTIIIFIAWVPLVYVADHTQNRFSFFLYSFLTTLVWNSCTTWWIWNSSDVGAIAAIIANSLLMTIPWQGYYICKKKYGKNIGPASLILFWITFEYIHLNWQLSWPWLTLGNVFAHHPNWVQWYEYTGTSGGSLWVLLLNMLFYDILKGIRKKNYKAIKIVLAACITFIPFTASYLIKSGVDISTGKTAANVIIIQPNIDPYDKELDASNFSLQLNILLSLSEKELDSNTRLVLWPETALSINVWQNQLASSAVYKPVFDFVKKHPKITLQTGTESSIFYGTNKETETAQFNERGETYYDDFNAAVSIKANAPLEFYDKSKLVPGVETLPGFLLWMRPVFEKFGGATGGYGSSKESEIFFQQNNPYISAPIICYESIYGEYVASYVSKGANILTIMTNDGWWGNTPGYQQHLDYARLRAIETRKWVARSANTGVSAVINNRGDIIASRPWNRPAFIKAVIPPETGKTFYVKYGDVLSKIAVIFSVLLIFWNVYGNIKTRLLKNKQ